MAKDLFYTIFISLILTTPFIWSDELYNGSISVKQIWFYGTMALLIFGFALDVVISRKKIANGFNLIDISLLLFYIYFLIRAYYTPYTPILYNQKFINYSLLVLFYFIVKHACQGSFMKNPFGHNQLENPLIVAITLVLLFTGLVEAIWGLMQLYGLTQSFHSGFKITGTFFNPAPYALYLSAVFPIALSLLIKELKNERILENERIKELKNERINGFTICKIEQLISLLLSKHRALKNKYAENPNSLILSFLHSFIKISAWLTVISILLVLPATMNRASWVGVGISSLFIFNQKYHWVDHLRGWQKTGTRKIIFLMGLLTLVAIITTGLYLLKKGSSMGRLFIWEVTAEKIAQKPLFGHGVGRFEAEYNNWQAEYFKNHPKEIEGSKGMAAGNTKYCFNEYLEMASEIGITGVVLFLVVFLSLLISRIRDEFSRNSFILSFLHSFIFSLIPLLVCALISFPFYSFPTLIVFFLLIAIISPNVKGIWVDMGLRNATFLRFFFKATEFIVLISVSVSLFSLARKQYLGYQRFNEALMLYQTEDYQEACRSFSEVYPSFRYFGPYLQYYGKALNMNKEYPQSIEILGKAARFTTDEVLYTTLGDSYKALKMYPAAEEVYLHASYMVPHKLYPRYLLANLYSEIGQKEKACSMAQEILNKKIKVESNATEEILRQMKDLIKELRIKN